MQCFISPLSCSSVQLQIDNSSWVSFVAQLAALYIFSWSRPLRVEEVESRLSSALLHTALPASLPHCTCIGSVGEVGRDPVSEARWHTHCLIISEGSQLCLCNFLVVLIMRLTLLQFRATLFLCWCEVPGLTSVH